MRLEEDEGQETTEVISSAFVKMCKDGRTNHIYLSDSIGRVPDYNEFVHALRLARPDEKFIVYLGGYGGSCHGMVALVSAIRQTKAHEVQMRVVSPCYSAHAELALVGTSLYMDPYTFLMFHNYSSFSVGKGGELMSAAHAEHKWLQQITQGVCAPFLTTDEIKELAKDQDIYVHWDDKNLATRMKRHFIDIDAKKDYTKTKKQTKR